MGNTNSNVKPRNPSPDGPQQLPHRSLRQKKRSLELPDLAQLAFTNAAPPRPHQSNPINIPTHQGASNGDADGSGGRKPLPPDFSAGDVTTYHMPVNQRRTARNDTRDFMPGPHRRGRSGVAAQYHPSIPSVLNLPTHNPHRSPFVQETVYSGLPFAIGKAEGLDAAAEDAPLLPEADPIPEPVIVTITWTGGGEKVLLARAGDDDWKGRQEMDQDPDTPTTYTTTVSLLPGTHHIRFLIDDTWRVADDLPTAVDDQGTLANYVAVPIPVPGVAPPPPPPPALKITPASAHPSSKMPTGPSFWSSNSDDSSSSYPSQYNHPATPHPTNQNATSIKHAPPAWTSVIPQELIEAAREEEAYLAASAAQHQMGFIPAPNIPPAPGLPRHLDRLILNGKSPGVGIVNGGRSGRGTPSGSSSRRDGRDRDRDRDRDGKERDGRGRDGREKSTRRKDRDREREKDRRDATPSIPLYTASAPTPPTSARAFSTAGPLADAVNSEKLTPTPEVRTTDPAGLPLPASPALGASSPTLVPSDSSSVSTLTPGASKPGSSSGTQPPSNITLPLPTLGVPSSSTALPLHLDPFSDGPGLADDASVLPVPNHVVLHHLSTSAIRNGVLAVGSTVRYRKKYLTIVYYKPT